MLIFPAKAPDAELAGGLQNGYLNGFALDQPVALPWLAPRDGHQRCIVDRLDETVTQRVQRSAQCAGGLRKRDMLLRLRAGGAIVDERAAGNSILAPVDGHGRIDEISVVIAVAYPDLGNLTGRSGHWVLMARHAGGSVEQRTETGARVAN